MCIVTGVTDSNLVKQKLTVLLCQKSNKNIFLTEKNSKLLGLGRGDLLIFFQPFSSENWLLPRFTDRLLHIYKHTNIISRLVLPQVTVNHKIKKKSTFFMTLTTYKLLLVSGL